MSDETIPVAAACNICGSSEFARGPSGRLSITGRLPLCAKCSSLERHRVVRAAFDALPDELFTGTRCLQFSPDPALNTARFAEVVVSVWGGENSLDMQAIALPDASFQWTYSSHVINHVPNARAAFRELLRVVGDGCIVLSVGGTAFSYATEETNRILGPDMQFKTYGTLFADDLQDVIRELAVLELVALDPCSVTIDSVYIASLDENRLLRMARAAAAHNVHARVFPAKMKPALRPLAPAAQPPRTPWEALQLEIREWKAAGGSGRFWLRDDGVATVEPRLIELVDLCQAEGVPLTLAAIPLSMTLQLVELIAGRDLTTIQYGFDQVNREPADQPKSEFPAERGGVEAMRSIQLGWYVLSEACGSRALPVFCPPWGAMAPKFQERLQGLGFEGYSGSQVGAEPFRQGKTPAGLRRAGAHVSISKPRTDAEPSFVEARILETLTEVVRTIRTERADEAVGIALRHGGVDEDVRQFLGRLFQTTRAAGAVWVGARELFSASALAGASPSALPTAARA